MDTCERAFRLERSDIDENKKGLFFIQIPSCHRFLASKINRLFLVENLGKELPSERFFDADKNKAYNR